MWQKYDQVCETETYFALISDTSHCQFPDEAHLGPHLNMVPCNSFSTVTLRVLPEKSPVATVTSVDTRPAPGQCPVLVRLTPSVNTVSVLRYMWRGKVTQTCLSIISTVNSSVLQTLLSNLYTDLKDFLWNNSVECERILTWKLCCENNLWKP